MLIPAAANPAQYCGPLWTDRSGRHLLAACGNDAEASIDNGQLTRLRSRWHLPSDPVPEGPRSPGSAFLPHTASVLGEQAVLR
ncbi:MAG: hypothetical protein ACRDRJ_11480 [Streptosporangiaceae bacterium]